jgi:NAD(P)-dependent dehydrogenase (short-subunit alcohol dehydrogenase family)
MTHSLTGKVVLVTGAARGIGAETARRLAACGARLSLVGLEPERLAALVRELGGEGSGHAWFACDVTDQPSLDRAVAGTVAALGGVDVVLANAGIASHGTVAAGAVDALARTIEVNLIGVVRTVSATLPHVTARRGYYLLMSSAAALAALPGMAAYAASKAGVEHFGHTLRLEVARHGVGVGVAHPCWIDTDLVRDVQADLSTFDAMRRALPGPFGAITSVEECAAALVDAIARRRRTVFVPRSLGRLAPFRQLLTSRLADRVVARQAGSLLPRLDADVRALGRSFGAHSVETGDRAAPPAIPDDAGRGAGAGSPVARSSP